MWVDIGISKLEALDREAAIEEPFLLDTVEKLQAAR